MPYERSDQPFCEKCRFYSAPTEHTTDADVKYTPDQGQCRRNPPSPIGPSYIPGWPYVYIEDWCGEYRRKES